MGKCHQTTLLQYGMKSHPINANDGNVTVQYILSKYNKRKKKEYLYYDYHCMIYHNSRRD